MASYTVRRAVKSFGALATSLLLTALVPLAHAQQGAQDMPVLLRLGSIAPAFTTKTTSGTTLTLKSLRGHVVLLDFWATWCAPCRAATPTLQALHTKFHSRGLRVVGISMDDGTTESDVKPFLKHAGVTYAVAVGAKADTTAAIAYNASALPTQYLIDKKGIIRWAQIGFFPTEKATLTSLIADLARE